MLQLLLWLLQEISCAQHSFHLFYSGYPILVCRSRIFWVEVKFTNCSNWKPRLQYLGLESKSNKLIKKTVRRVKCSLQTSSFIISTYTSNLTPGIVKIRNINLTIQSEFLFQKIKISMEIYKKKKKSSAWELSLPAQ